MKRRSRTTSVIVFVAVIMLAAACGGSSKKSDTSGGAASPSAGSNTPTASPTKLVGLFKVTPGACDAGGKATGSWFRMVQSGGTLAAGPFVANGDSTCSDKTWTPLTPGTDGGLRTGAYQPGPASAFDAGGNGTAAAILAPQPWFAVKFALSSNAVDPQTKAKTAEPTIQAAGTTLTGDLRALGAAWNQQFFNQGSPKPTSEASPNTAPVKGTYDPATKAYTLDWASQIAGGPFDKFTGVYHLEGTFQAG